MDSLFSNTNSRTLRSSASSSTGTPAGSTLAKFVFCGWFRAFAADSAFIRVISTPNKRPTDLIAFLIATGADGALPRSTHFNLVLTTLRTLFIANWLSQRRVGTKCLIDRVSERGRLKRLWYPPIALLAAFGPPYDEPTKWQHIGNQIDATFVFARADFVNVHVLFIRPFIRLVFKMS